MPTMFEKHMELLREQRAHLNVCERRFTPNAAYPRGIVNLHFEDGEIVITKPPSLNSQVGTAASRIQFTAAEAKWLAVVLHELLLKDAAPDSPTKQEPPDADSD